MEGRLKNLVWLITASETCLCIRKIEVKSDNTTKVIKSQQFAPSLLSVSLVAVFQLSRLLSWKNTETWSQKGSGFSAHLYALLLVSPSLFGGKCCSFQGH